MFSAALWWYIWNINFFMLFFLHFVFLFDFICFISFTLSEPSVSFFEETITCSAISGTYLTWYLLIFSTYDPCPNFVQNFLCFIVCKNVKLVSVFVSLHFQDSMTSYFLMCFFLLKIVSPRLNLDWIVKPNKYSISRYILI